MAIILDLSVITLLTTGTFKSARNKTFLLIILKLLNKKNIVSDSSKLNNNFSPQSLAKKEIELINAIC